MLTIETCIDGSGRSKYRSHYIRRRCCYLYWSSTKVYTAEIELESETSHDVAGANLSYLGFAGAQTIGVNASNSVSTVDTLTRQNSNRMIQVIDRALEQVSEDRSGLGALQNRLESTLNNVANISREPLRIKESYPRC